MTTYSAMAWWVNIIFFFYSSAGKEVVAFLHHVVWVGEEAKAYLKGAKGARAPGAKFSWEKV